MNLRPLRNKTLSALLASTLLLGQSIPLAQAIPQSYWQYQVPFQTAQNSQDYDALVPIALAIEGIMVSEPDDQSTREILYGVYEQLALAYEHYSDYDTTVYYLQKQIEYAQKLNYDDAVIIAEKRILQLNPMTEVYALTQNLWQDPYYGAMYEPTSGAYFGRTYGNEAPLSQESAISFYVECLKVQVSQYDYLIAPYDDGTRLLQICLNMPQEADSLRAVMDSSSDQYLLETMQYLAQMKSPVLLRIAGEMNVYSNACTPEEFKSAYIKIAQYARDYAPNVALVFSPNSISTWGMSHLDYYPGDQWVDWVGLSAYTHLYYNAYDPYGTADHDNMFYGTGEYSDPIRNLKEIVETFGDRKPIIISESGSGYVHTQLPELSNSLQAFSESQIRKLYTYANMVFPQIKAIISFDQVMDEEYHFAPYANWGVWTNYLSAIENNPTLISSVQNQNNHSYVSAGNYSDSLETLSLAAFSIPVGVNALELRYVLDGNTILTSSTLPYNCDIDVASLSMGTHSVEVHFSGDNAFSQVKYYALEKGDGTAVTLRELDSAFTPDVSPEVPETPNTSLEGIPDWAMPYVNFVATAIMPDISGANFVEASTRGLIAQCLYNLSGEGQDIAPSHNFGDVGNFATAIAWCHHNSVMTGYSDTEFGTTGNVTREQFALILEQASKALGKTTLNGNDSILSNFGDEESITYWARAGMAWAVENGLMSGSDGNLNPQGQITRTEVAVMLYQFAGL